MLQCITVIAVPTSWNLPTINYKNNFFKQNVLLSLQAVIEAEDAGTFSSVESPRKAGEISNKSTSCALAYTLSFVTNSIFWFVASPLSSLSSAQPHKVRWRHRAAFVSVYGVVATPTYGSPCIAHRTMYYASKCVNSLSNHRYLDMSSQM